MREALKAQGFPLFPVAGKVPLWQGWPTKATADIDTREIPGNYGVALRDTDLVIDLDPRNFREGAKPFRQLLTAFFPNGQPPDTFMVRTGGGGIPSAPPTPI